MMAKKLQKNAKPAPDPAMMVKVGKVVATTGGKTKKVAKVKAKPIARKKLNKPTYGKNVKK